MVKRIKHGTGISSLSAKKTDYYMLSTMNRFTLCTIANYRGRLYNLPFNMYTFHQMWGFVTPRLRTRRKPFVYPPT